MRFEELDWQSTPWGVISLRRRWDPAFSTDVHEIKLDDDFLMSSLFTVAESEMVRLAFSRLDVAPDSVAVGGLGLGYTAQAVLDNPDVGALVAVEGLAPVIEWHQRGLIPLGSSLTSDPRSEFVHGDFFALLRDGGGLDPREPDRRFDAVIVDIDHSPRHVLHPSHADFYEPVGLKRLAAILSPGGVFALWSNDPPDSNFVETLGQVFTDVAAEVVEFPNPLQDRDAANTIYLARRSPLV
jgi:spermidine synthase